MSVWKRIDNFGFSTFGNVARWLCRLTGVSSRTLGTFLLHVWFLLDAAYWILLDHSLGNRAVGISSAGFSFIVLRIVSKKAEGEVLVYALSYLRVYSMIYLILKILLHVLDPSDRQTMIHTGIWMVVTLAIYALSLDIPKRERKEWVWGLKPKTT